MSPWHVENRAQFVNVRSVLLSALPVICPVTKTNSQDNLKELISYFLSQS